MPHGLLTARCTTALDYPDEDAETSIGESFRSTERLLCVTSMSIRGRGTEGRIRAQTTRHPTSPAPR